MKRKNWIICILLICLTSVMGCADVAPSRRTFWTAMPDSTFYADEQHFYLGSDASFLVDSDPFFSIDLELCSRSYQGFIGKMGHSIYRTKSSEHEPELWLRFDVEPGDTLYSFSTARFALVDTVIGTRYYFCEYLLSANMQQNSPLIWGFDEVNGFEGVCQLHFDSCRAPTYKHCAGSDYFSYVSTGNVGARYGGTTSYAPPGAGRFYSFDRKRLELSLVRTPDMDQKSIDLKGEEIAHFLKSCLTQRGDSIVLSFDQSAFIFDADLKGYLRE